MTGPRATPPTPYQLARLRMAFAFLSAAAFVATIEFDRLNDALNALKGENDD